MAFRIIYALQCTESKFYIGLTTKPIEERFEEHKRGDGAYWTRKYPPVTIDRVEETQSPFAEDLMLLEYVEKYGVENVRGGTFSQITLPEHQLKTIEDMICHARSLCYMCRSPDHFTRNCPKQLWPSPSTDQE